MSLDIVNHVAENIHPDGTPERNFEFVKAVAYLVEAGLVKAPAGGENVHAYKDVFVRTNRVVYPDGKLVKVLRDAGPGGANTPAWDVAPELEPDLYVALEDAPEPPGEPSTPAPDLTPILARIDALEGRQAALSSRLEEVVGAVNTIVDQFGMGVREVLAKMRVKGNTSRAWGHAHTVSLEITEEK